MRIFSLLWIKLLILNTINFSQDSSIIVKADKILTDINPEMWGIFFEDINFSADGGIYAELIKNRSFEFNDPMMGWAEVKENGAHGKTLIINDGNETNSRFMRIKLNSEGRYGIKNEGFRGIGVHKEKELKLSLMMRVCDSAKINVDADLIDSNGKVVGHTAIAQISGDWRNYTASLFAKVTDADCSLRLLFSGEGTVDIDMISLFPADTWKQRKNGLRADLVQMLADLKPGFIRFPGGCIVEGRELLTRYQWKNTVGSVDQRRSIVNRWNSEFKHRLTPDYFQSFGLGFYEYFLLAEDLGAEPLPVINCGMACQFNTAEIAEEQDIYEYIQDALDLIEFANGEITTKWGNIRADMGHPPSFNMKYLGIGNEQWGEQYIQIYKLFAKVLKNKHPEIKLIVSAGSNSEGEEFDFLWKHHRSLNSDIVDEHYYKKPDWFFSNANRYDNYNRKGPKVFAGEYAAQSVAVCSPDNKNTWLCALSEAAFMTGLERNADIVSMASYAPLLSHTDAWQWTPDLIYFDNLRCLGSANYYVQKLFSNNRGTHTVSITESGVPLTGQHSIYASACIDRENSELIIKVVNSSAEDIEKHFFINGVSVRDNEAELILLSDADPGTHNTMEEPDKIAPVMLKLKIDNGKLTYKIQGYSFSVLKIKLRS